MKDSVDKWTKIGLDTTPINWDKAVEAVKQVYKCGGLESPKQFYRCASPLGAIVLINIFKNTKDISDSVWSSVADSVADSVWASVRDSVGDSVADSKLEYIRSTLEGQHNAGWVGFYDYFRNECGLVEETEKLSGIIEATKECGWMYLYPEIAIICDRPSTLYRDNLGRLHSDDCEAVGYRDGYKIYAWHGTLVPEYVIMNPEKITLEDIMTEKNQEVKRVKIQKFGIEKLIGSDEVIKIDENLEFGELYKTKTLKDIDGKPFSFIKVINSTPEIECELSKELIGIEGRLKYYDYIEKIGYNEKEIKEINSLKQRKAEIEKEVKVNKKIYTLRVDPKYNNVVEAWQSTFRKVKQFNPIIET
jgi:hypothetical protein